MKPLYTKFMRSATDARQFPAPSAPEVAFLGRSNVGKSSLINALLGREEARVSSTPGRTRAINFFALEDSPGDPSEPARREPRRQHNARMIFADLPGYGYAKLSKSISAEWPKFIEPYLRERATLALCVCLVDSTIEPRASDAQLIEFLRHARRRFVVAGTKADRLSGNGRAQAMKRLREAFGDDDLLLVSAKTGAGMKELWAAIAAAAAGS
jgi:GTP-binding protein